MDLNQNVNENVDTGTLRIHLTNESNGTPVQGSQKFPYLIREIRHRRLRR